VPERLFHLRKRGTDVRTEVPGGITTFVALAHIIVVNPAILAVAGIPPGPSTVAGWGELHPGRQAPAAPCAVYCLFELPH
jgi:hypothetical protein